MGPLLQKLLALGSATAPPKCSNISRRFGLIWKEHYLPNVNIRCEAIAMLVHVSILTAQLTCPTPGGEGAEDREGKWWGCAWR